MITSEIALKQESALLQQLLEQYAGETEDQELVDCLANETDIKRQIVAVLKLSEEAEAFAEAIKAIIGHYKERKERFERKSERLRAIVSQVMEETNLAKIVEPEMTVSMRIGLPSIVTTINPKDAPSPFVKTKVTYTFDNQALRSALAAGEDLGWAHFGNAAPVLTVRVK